MIEISNMLASKIAYWLLHLYFQDISPSHAAIKILINATAAEFICKNIFPTPVQVKTNYKK